MRLRSGVEATSALRALDDAIRALHQAIGVTGDDWNLARTYIAAVSTVDRALRFTFEDVPIDRLYNSRVWAINAFEGLRIGELTRDEAERQIAWLTGTREHLERALKRFAGDGAVLAVLDTNTLLHYRLFGEVPWPEVLGAKAVRLVVPLRVIDELDEKKWARRGEFRARARTVIKHIAAALDDETPIRHDVMLSVVGLGQVDPDAFRRPPFDADTDILDVADALRAFPSRGVCVVSGDLGMQIRARDRGLAVSPMPDEFRQRLPDESAVRD